MTASTQAGLRASLYQDAPIPLAVELHCPPGTVLALLGPSGSGKTTVLRTIAGLMHPQRGAIHCNDAVWVDTDAGIRQTPQQRRVGYLFQHFALFPHLTAAENVMAGLEHLPRSERAARARDLLMRVHLDGLGDRRPAALSGGQQQRVAMARALARDPAALLLDEPFSSVDRATREKLYRELATLRRTLAMPIILVTHDLAEAAMLADRIAVLHRGRTLQSGPTGMVMTQPASATVARLIDIRNIFSATVLAQGSDGSVIDWQGIRLEAPGRSDFPPGSRCQWCIRASQIVLHRRDRPSQGERENPVSGRIVEMVSLGDTVGLDIEVNGARLQFSLSSHVAQRNGLAPNEMVTVSLRAEGIHLMPEESATT